MTHSRRLAGFACALLLVAAVGTRGCEPDLLRVAKPFQGTFHTTSTVELWGTAPGASDAVTVNDSPAASGAGDRWSFAAALPSTTRFHPFLVRRPDAGPILRTLMSGPDVAAGDTTERGLSFRITEGGLRALALALEGSSLLDFGNLVSPGDKFGDLKVDKASAEHASVRINMADGRVKLRISIFDLEIEGEAKDQGPFDEDCNVDIEADRLTMAVFMELRPVRENQTFVLGGDVKRVSLDFDEFDGDVSGCNVTKFLGDLLGDVESELEDAFEDGVRDFLSDQAFAEELRALTGAFSNLGINLDTSLAAAREDDDGFTLAHDVVVKSPKRAPGAPKLTASLAGAASDPRFDSVIPGGGTPFDFALGISAETLNQLLRGETVGGLLRQQELLWDPDDPNPVISVLLEDLGHEDPSEPLWLKIDPRLAPLVEEDEGDGGHFLSAEFGQLELTLWNGATGATRARVATYFPLGLDLDFEEGGWQPRLETPSASDIRAVVLSNQTARDDAFVASLVQQLLSVFLPEFGAIVDDLPPLSVPLEREGEAFARLGFDPLAADYLDGVPALFADVTTQICLNAAGELKRNTIVLSCGHDEDRDGVASKAPPVTTEVCLSDSACPVGWLEVDDASPIDCDDLDDRVFPGQTELFDGKRRNGSRDFDCDGENDAAG